MQQAGKYYDKEEIKKAIALLHSGKVFEVRIINPDRNGPAISGYFTETDTLFKEFEKVDLRGKNVYATLQTLSPDCMSRAQANHFLQTKVTSSDKDVSGYEWLFIDVDPVRMTGVSSTAEELAFAKTMAGKIAEYLDNLGFEHPIVAMSGNGYHLLYKIALMNNEENRQLVADCLKVISDLFSDDRCKVDTVNGNPSRICKLHGTLSQKGTDTQERPHRLSRIISNTIPKITNKAYLQKLAEQLPHDDQQQQQAYQTAPTGTFDLESFLDRHELTYTKREGDRAIIYALDHCPFNPDHVNGDSKIFLYPNGAIAFKCHHNSCSGKKWQDVRMKYEPDAYQHVSEDDERIEAGWREHNRKKEAEQIQPPQEDHGDMFRTMSQILADPAPQHEYIRCGIEAIDNSMGGLEKTGVSVMSGLRGCGKSTLIGQIILTAIDDGHTVVSYSGELDNHKYLDWMMRQAAGKSNVDKSQKFQNAYFVSDEIKNKIAEWAGDNFWLYNNKYGNEFTKLAEFIKAQILKTKADICIIDNLMALDLSQLNNRDQYAAQTQFVWKLKEIAEQTNTHILFVAHPRKAYGFLRLSDISGSGNIGNIVDEAFIIHRNNQDFQKGFKEFFGRDAETEVGDCTNCIEVAKDREGGLQDRFIPLWFEESTKRLKNNPVENVVYGWERGSDFIPADLDEIPF